MLEKLKQEHKKLKEFLDSNPSGLIELLKKHFNEEEEFLEKHKGRLGGNDELSPLGMVKNEHKLILEKIEKVGLTDDVRELIKYHLAKEETQIFILLE